MKYINISIKIYQKIDKNTQDTLDNNFCYAKGYNRIYIHICNSYNVYIIHNKFSTIS